MKLFLDDVRSPQNCLGYMHLRIGNQNPIYNEGGWFIVRSYDEFVVALKKYYKDITHISFDHDLAEEHYHESMSDDEAYSEYLKGSLHKTGYDCAVFAKKFYNSNNLSMPICFIHSMNPAGCKRIENAIEP